MASVPLKSEISVDSWQVAQEITNNILWRIQPTAESEERRSDIIQYVMKLTRRQLKVEVLPSGSVPLKTYLPDGDIDLTALAEPNSETGIAEAICSLLKSEEENTNAEFIIKDVRLINAEVKLVKCVIQDIAVDITVNQIGGLCTLCFLELVDRYIAKNCLFKRSIILIKAWCYYESRTLGAHNGLISTYALEILVMYIFHLFHSSLDGPLAVLYKFLDYYGNFDWDEYCITVYGPISLSSPPELVAEEQENFLFEKNELKNAVEIFSVPPKVSENTSQIFMRKYFNIVDPLKESNNLGRSVSRGNSYRIQSAFRYGGRKLDQILLLPQNQIAQGLGRFFANIIERHPVGGSHLQVTAFDLNGPASSTNLMVEHDSKINLKGKLPVPDLTGELCSRIGKMKVSGTMLKSALHASSGPLHARAELYGLSEEVLFSSIQAVGVTQYMARSAPPVSQNYPWLSGSNAPYLLPQSSIIGDHPLVTNQHRINEAESSSSAANAQFHATGMNIRHINVEDGGYEEEGNEVPPHLSILVGDYDLHHNSLLFAMHSMESSGGFISPSYLLQWHCVYMQLSVEFLHPGLPFSPSRSIPIISPYLSRLLMDEQRQRGTGTYIPCMNEHEYKERLESSAPRGPRSIQQELGMDSPRRGGHHQQPFSPVQFPPRSWANSRRPPLPPRFRLQQPSPSCQGWRHYSSSFTDACDPGPVSVAYATAVEVPEASHCPVLPKRSYQLEDEEDFPVLPGQPHR